MRRGHEDRFQLLEAPVEVEQLGTPLPNELLVEPVATEHLDEQPAEVPEALVLRREQRTPLASQHPRRGKDDPW